MVLVIIVAPIINAGFGLKEAVTGKDLWGLHTPTRI